MQIVTGRRGEPHVTSRQMQAVYRSFLGDFALLDIGEKLRAEAYSDDIVRVYDGVVSVQGIYAVIAYNQYDEVYIEPVSVGKKRIDTIVLHYTKDNALDVEDMQLDVVQGEEYTDNPIAPVVPEGGDAWEGTTDIQVPIYDVEVTNFGLTVTPYARMLNLIPTLESIAERIPETVVTGVKGDSEVLYRDGDVNITKENIGLGNVDNTADTDKPISTATQTALNLKADLTYVDAKISAAYHAGGSKTVAELTSALLIADNIGKVYNMSDSGVTTSDFVEGAGEPINEGDNVGICNVGTEESPVYKFDLLSGFVDLSAYATTSTLNAGLAGKVDKVAGKGLSTEDYTTTDKTKLAGISEGATQTIANPADTATETLSKLEVGGVVYDIPQGASGATELSELTDVNLSNVEDNDILQYDETANKWKNSNALQGAKTATGNPITIEDAAPVNAVNLSIDLEPIQEGSGDPSPSNVRPISGFSSVEVQRDGKNLFNIEQWLSTYSVSYVKDNNTYTFNTELSLFNNYYEFNKPINIILSSIKEGGTATNVGFLFYDENDNELTGRILSGTINNAKKFRLDFSLGGSLTLKDPMIRLATVADATFEPYTGVSHSIALGSTIYGGELDVTRGKMVVTHGEVDLGDLNWMYDPTSWIGANFYAELNNIKYIGDYATTTYPILCEKYKVVARNLDSFVDDSITVDGSVGQPTHIQVKDSTYTDAIAFKTAVTGTKLVYELATPYTIQLTPQQIKLLKGTNSIYANSGDLSIKYQPDNVLGDLLAEAEIGYDKQIEYIKTSLVPSRERNDITDRLQMLPQAIAEQNLEKYGYKIGDYFQGVESTPYTYSLADYNTFKGTLTPYCLTQNHLGIVVDTHTTSQWYSGDASSVGYNGSTLHTYLKSTVMDNIKADMIALFGGSTGLEHLLPHSKLLTTALANWGWQTNQYISALSEIQAIGSTVWSANSYQIGEVAKKLEIFNKYKWTEIFEGRYPWLRDMQSASYACYLNGAGNADYYSVVNANFVVGLIIFY